MHLAASILYILVHTWDTLLRKVGLQLRLREDDTQDRDFSFPQGCHGLLQRPGVDPPVVQQDEQGALVGALIGHAVYVVWIARGVAYL